MLREVSRPKCHTGRSIRTSPVDSAIHRARPTVQAAAHCHSIHGKTWSAFGRPVEILTQDSCLFFDNCGVYTQFGGIVLAQEEGENIAKALGPKVCAHHVSITCLCRVCACQLHLSANHSRHLSSRHASYRTTVYLPSETLSMNAFITSQLVSSRR